MTSAKSGANSEIDLVELALAIIDEATMTRRLADQPQRAEISGERGVTDQPHATEAPS